MKLDALSSHLEECEFNPKRPVPCEQGCGLVVPKDELKVSHVDFSRHRLIFDDLLYQGATLRGSCHDKK